MKKLVFFVLLFSVTACAAPPAITVASLALSGVSYLETGKTLPDHALSSVAQRDCIVLRAARGEQICRNDAPVMTATAEPVIEVAAGPDEAGGSPWDANTATPPRAAAAALTLAALAPPPPVPTGTVTVESLAPLPPQSDAAPAASWASPAFALMAAADPASSRSSVFVPIITGDVTAPPERPRRKDSQSRRLDAPPPAATGPQRHLVVGSFRDRARAETHVARLAEPGLRIVAAEVKGRTQYRVVTGPLARAELGAAKRTYAKKGIKGAWAIFLEADDARIQLAAR